MPSLAAARLADCDDNEVLNPSFVIRDANSTASNIAFVSQKKKHALVQRQDCASLLSAIFCVDLEGLSHSHTSRRLHSLHLVATFRRLPDGAAVLSPAVPSCHSSSTVPGPSTAKVGGLAQLSCGASSA